MHHVLFVASLVAVALLALGCAVGAVRLARERRHRPTSPAAHAAVKHADRTSVLAVLALAATVAAAAWLAQTPLPVEHGPVLAALAPASALTFLAVHALGELTWPRPQGAGREARIVSRTVTDVTPAALRHVTLAWLGGLLVAAAAFALQSSGPRSVSRVSGMDTAYTVSPFPGTWLTVPAVVAALVLAGAVWSVLRLVAVRPAVAGVDPAWDMWLRRRTASRVLRGTQAALGGTLAAVLGLAGAALLALGGATGPLGTGPAPDPDLGHVVAGATLLVVAAVVLLVAVVVASRPSIAPAPALVDTVAEPAVTEVPA